MVGNFFLIGLMGSGKTTIGRQLSLKLNKQFYDTDHEIVARMGVPITTMFEIEGEEKFRERESRVLSELVQNNNIVLATGGGIVLREMNRQLLRRHGTVIYLQVDIDVILERTRFDRSRPLLQTENPRAKLETLFQERDALYQSTADIIINANEIFLPSLMKKILKTIDDYQLKTQ